LRSAQWLREKLPSCASASQLRFSVSTPCVLPTRPLQSDRRSHSADRHRHHIVVVVVFVISVVAIVSDAVVIILLQSSNWTSDLFSTYSYVFNVN